LGSIFPKQNQHSRLNPFQIIVPLLILVVSVIQILWYAAVMEPVDIVDISDLPEKILLFGSCFILIVIIQRIIDTRRVYALTVTGLALWYYGEVENLMDEFYEIDYGLVYDLEIIVPIGILITGIGILSYTGMLLQSDREVSQKQRETDLYASLLRHDLSNDLQALMGYLEAALMFSETIPPKALDLLDSAQVAGSRMSRLIKAFAKTHTSNLMDLMPLIKKLSADAEQAHRGLQVQIEAPDDVGTLRTYGSALFPAALENLFRNSYEYAGPEVTVTIKVSKVEDNALILFSDNGDGIPLEKQEMLFSRGNTGTDRGMGLYLTRTIIRACGGEVFHIPESTGAKFKIIIPILK
jgi:signal transduction histidine kinase